MRAAIACPSGVSIGVHPSTVHPPARAAARSKSACWRPVVMRGRGCIPRVLDRSLLPVLQVLYAGFGETAKRVADLRADFDDRARDGLLHVLGGRQVVAVL